MSTTGKRSLLRSAGLVGLWLITVFAALTMGVAGLSKFGNSGMWTANFIEWGYPGWFSKVIGAAEVGGALAVLIPRFAPYAAGVIIPIMLGALFTVIKHDSPLGVFAPIMHLVLFSTILMVRIRMNKRRAMSGE